MQRDVLAVASALVDAGVKPGDTRDPDRRRTGSSGCTATSGSRRPAAITVPIYPSTAAGGRRRRSSTTARRVLAIASGTDAGREAEGRRLAQEGRDHRRRRRGVGGPPATAARRGRDPAGDDQARRPVHDRLHVRHHRRPEGRRARAPQSGRHQPRGRSRCFRSATPTRRCRSCRTRTSSSASTASSSACCSAARRGSRAASTTSRRARRGAADGHVQRAARVRKDVCGGDGARARGARLPAGAVPAGRSTSARASRTSRRRARC